MIDYRARQLIYQKMLNKNLLSETRENMPKIDIPDTTKPLEGIEESTNNGLALNTYLISLVQQLLEETMTTNKYLKELVKGTKDGTKV